MSTVKDNARALALKESILADIVRGDNLLSLPANLAKVLEVINDENASIDSLADAIQRDPSLTATIIRMANTPYYGRMTRCSSLHDAVMTLGSLTMKSVALTATVLNPKNIQEQCGINPEEFVANSLTVATLAREIAFATGYPAPEDALTAGLLHDIGVLYFMSSHSVTYSEVAERVAKGDSMPECEMSTFGIDHMKVGEELISRWHLPEVICKCVGAHHQADRGEVPEALESDVLMTIVQLAVAVAGDSYLQQRRKLDCDLKCVSALSASLKLSDEKLSEIVSKALTESLEVASGFGMNESSVETLMATANKKLGHYLNSLQRLMRDREELSVKILSEERRKGVAESRIAIMASLSHHINNSAMVAMGKAEALSVILEKELSKSAFSPVARDLQTIVESLTSIKTTLEQMSHVADSDIMAVYDKSKTLDLDTLIRNSVRLDKSSLSLIK
jgi:putative nucleotidyltransferase with HDIG domain